MDDFKGRGGIGVRASIGLTADRTTESKPEERRGRGEGAAFASQRSSFVTFEVTKKERGS